MTPAELLFGRTFQTRFHKLYPDQSLVVEKEKRWQKEAHDKGTRWRKFQQLEWSGTCAEFQTWGSGWVTEMMAPVSYKVFDVVTTSSGGGMWIILIRSGTVKSQGSLATHSCDAAYQFGWDQQPGANSVYQFRGQDWCTRQSRQPCCIEPAGGHAKHWG